MKHLFFLSVVLLALTGCVNNKGHRSELGNICQYSQEEQCPSAAFTRQTTKHSAYHLGFIEFDDQGFLQSRQRKNHVINQLRERVKIAGDTGKPVLMITFIHGWHHNANGAPEDRDVHRFRQYLLAEAADFYPDYEVLGVYLAWRGLVLKGPFKYLTFWDRKRTAHEVGQNGMTSVLLEMEDAVKGYPVRAANNKLITVGHSFGGAALYSAIKGVLASRFVQSRPFGTTQAVDGYGDLVLLMNPAFESLQYQALFELSQYQCLPYPDSQLPKFMVLASQQDKAVGWTFPIGRFPATVLENHENKMAQSCQTPNVTSQEYPVKQWAADVLAIGHHVAYNSHELKRATTSTPRLLDTGDSRESWLAFQRSGETVLPITPRVDLVSTEKTLPNNPYMSIFVRDDLIPGHSDIWEPEVVEFINEMIQITGKVRN